MSDPLDHLLSVDLGESTPLCDVFEDESKTRGRSKKPVKKVRFADTSPQPVQNVFKRKLTGVNRQVEIASRPNTKEVKGILKVIRNSNFDGHKTVKGWSKPSLPVPLTVNILSSTESEAKSTDFPDKSFTGYKNLQLVTTMDEDSVAGPDADEDSSSKGLNEQEDSSDPESSEHNLSSPTHAECKLDDNKCDASHLLKEESNVEFQSLELGTLQVKADTFGDDLSYTVEASCDGTTEHDFDQDKHLLEDEIRKISKELFLETASHLEEAKSEDGSVKSEILLHRNFISTDIVNDILDAQSGREKVPNETSAKKSTKEHSSTSQKADLFLQDAENSVTIEGIRSQIEGVFLEKNLIPDDSTQGRESSVAKLVSRVKRPPSPHTQKLKRALEENVPQKPTAKDLRSIVYNAWCAIKADEKKILVKKLKDVERQTQESILKEKSLKEASAMKAFMCWKEQKEKVIKHKKENEMKTVETKLSKAQEDQKKKKEEADLVFKAWKKKKDEELKEWMRKQKLKTKRELTNKTQSEEMKKLDAAAAFNAWKSQKLELQRKEKESLEKKDLETSLRDQEKSERDKEALKAYELWLECKEQYDAGYDWRNQLESKPPWSPPGRIT